MSDCEIKEECFLDILYHNGLGKFANAIPSPSTICVKQIDKDKIIISASDSKGNVYVIPYAFDPTYCTIKLKTQHTISSICICNISPIHLCLLASSCTGILFYLNLLKCNLFKPILSPIKNKSIILNKPVIDIIDSPYEFVEKTDFYKCNDAKETFIEKAPDLSIYIPLNIKKILHHTLPECHYSDSIWAHTDSTIYHFRIKPHKAVSLTLIREKEFYNTVLLDIRFSAKYKDDRRLLLVFSDSIQVLSEKDYNTESIIPLQSIMHPIYYKELIYVDHKFEPAVVEYRSVICIQNKLEGDNMQLKLYVGNSTNLMIKGVQNGNIVYSAIRRIPIDTIDFEDTTTMYNDFLILATLQGDVSMVNMMNINDIHIYRANKSLIGFSSKYIGSQLCFLLLEGSGMIEIIRGIRITRYISHICIKDKITHFLSKAN